MVVSRVVRTFGSTVKKVVETIIEKRGNIGATVVIGNFGTGGRRLVVRTW